MYYCQVRSVDNGLLAAPVGMAAVRPELCLVKFSDVEDISSVGHYTCGRVWISSLIKVSHFPFVYIMFDESKGQILIVV